MGIISMQLVPFCVFCTDNPNKENKTFLNGKPKLFKMFLENPYYEFSTIFHFLLKYPHVICENDSSPLTSAIRSHN